MERYREVDPQFGLYENALPYVIEVMKLPCSFCKRRQEFLCCKSCSENDHCQVLQQLVEADDQFSTTFTGVTSEFVKLKVDQLHNAIFDLKRIHFSAIKNTENLKKKAQMNVEISKARKRLRALHQLQQLQEDKLRRLSRGEVTVREKIKKLRDRMERYSHKKDKITQYISTKMEYVTKRNKLLGTSISNLTEMRIVQVRDLTTSIFPLAGIEQENGDDSGGVRTPSLNLIEEELTEARRLSFLHGRWIYDQREGPDIIRISISSPRVSAPVDGNYAVCEAWLRSMLRISATPSEQVESEVQLLHSYSSTGSSIFAALCFCTQLMHILQTILDFHLPYKLSKRSFSNPHVTVQEFLWNVHKLNGNILAFCLHYGVDSRLIHPLHTLSNLQNGIQMCLHNSGSTSSLPLSRDLMKSLQLALDESSDPLPDDEEDKIAESLSEWESSMRDDDWETVLPDQSASEHQYVSGTPFQSQVQNLMGQSQEIVSSAISWISKGWWR